jgi:hypothetical protein
MPQHRQYEETHDKEARKESPPEEESTAYCAVHRYRAGDAQRAEGN